MIVCAADQAKTRQRKPAMSMKNKKNKYEECYGSDTSSDDDDDMEYEVGSDTESCHTDSNRHSEDAPTCSGNENDTILDYYEGDLTTGDFVLAKFDGEKENTYRYVCMIQENKEPLFGAIGLVASQNSKRIFLVNESDEHRLGRTDIIKKLPTPDLVQKGQRLRYKFDRDIDILENENTSFIY